MKNSKVLAKLRAGGCANSFKINLCSGQATEMAAQFGFDCIWLDMEHIAQDYITTQAQNWAAQANGCDVMVRVPRGSYSDLVKPFEMGATGILVPHVMSLEDAKKVVHYTRFHPIGRRPIDGGNADGDYGVAPFDEYLAHGNRERFIALQIEDPEPLDELEEIAALPGYDMLFFGPGDFSQGIGAPGVWDNPLLTETRKRSAEVARKHGKFAATVGSYANAKELHEMGYQFINLGADVVGYAAYLKEVTAGWKNTGL